MLNYILDKQTGDIILHSGVSPDSDTILSSIINGDSVTVRNHSSNFFFNIFNEDGENILPSDIIYDTKYITFNFSGNIKGVINVFFVSTVRDIIQVSNTPTPTPTPSTT